MTLIAKRPCSFGGRSFFIDDTVPSGMVTDPALQEKLGVISIVEKGGTDTEDMDFTLPITVHVDKNRDIDISLSGDEIRQVFSILQMTAEDSIRAVADIRSEDVLILIHASDSRKTIKNAAKEQADKLFSAERVLNERAPDETTGANMEGADS